MKSKIIIALLALISVSCSVQTNTSKNEVKPTPSSNGFESSSPTPYPIEPTLTPIADTTGLDIGERDNIYVSDTGNKAIRKITPDGIVSTIYKE